MLFVAAYGCADGEFECMNLGQCIHNDHKCDVKRKYTVQNFGRLGYFFSNIDHFENFPLSEKDIRNCLQLVKNLIFSRCIQKMEIINLQNNTIVNGMHYRSF